MFRRSAIALCGLLLLVAATAAGHRRTYRDEFPIDSLVPEPTWVTVDDATACLAVTARRVTAIGEYGDDYIVLYGPNEKGSAYRAMEHECDYGVDVFMVNKREFGTWIGRFQTMLESKTERSFAIEQAVSDYRYYLENEK